MAERVYIETTVVSYLTAWPSRDLVIAAHQQLTREWWDTQRQNYELCISQVVVKESSQGDAKAAEERLKILQGLAILEISAAALELAKQLIQIGALPPKSTNDALHVAVAADNRVPYLLTWNCRHLANARMRPAIESACSVCGLKAPVICTPEELLEPKP